MVSILKEIGVTPEASDTHQGCSIIITLATIHMLSPINNSETHTHAQTGQESKAQQHKLWLIHWTIYSQIFIEHQLYALEEQNGGPYSWSKSKKGM